MPHNVIVFSGAFMPCLSFNERRDFLLKDITLSEIRDAINNLRDSFPELDDIWNGHVMNLGTENKSTVIEDDKKILNTCHVPSSWSNVQIITVKKWNHQPKNINS